MEKDSHDTDGHDEKPPVSVTEAVFRVLWPLRRYTFGTPAIFALIIIGAFFYFNPEAGRDLARGIYDRIINLTKSPTRLVVRIPSNADAFPISVAELEGIIKAKAGRSIGDFKIASKSSTEEDGLYNLDFTFEKKVDGLHAGATLKTKNGSPIGQIQTILKNEYIDIGSPYIVESLINEMDVNWATLKAQSLRHRCDPSAYALFRAAQDVSLSNRNEALKLIKAATEQDPKFAMGFWYFGQLLASVGRKEDAAVADKRAKQLDPEHPRIDTSFDPTEAMARAIRSAKWIDFEPGFSVINVHQSDYQIELSGWRIDPRKFQLRIIEQESDFGQDTAWFRDKSNAILAMNTGRFKLDQAKRLSADGLLIIDKVERSAPWPAQKGGVFWIDGNRVGISPARTNPNGFNDLKYQYAVQAIPIMVEPGGVWAMNANDYDRQNRSAACILRDGTVILIAIYQSGLSLFELVIFCALEMLGKSLNVIQPLLSTVGRQLNSIIG